MMYKPTIIVLGMSGVGKTTLGDYASTHENLLWVEYDRESYKEAYCQVGSKPFAPRDPNRFDDSALAELNSVVNHSKLRGSLVTFPSNVMVAAVPESFMRAMSLSVVCLCAPVKTCYRSYVDRTRSLGGKVKCFRDWFMTNEDIARRIQNRTPGFRLYYLSILDEGGNRKSCAEILCELQQMVGVK